MERVVKLICHLSKFRLVQLIFGRRLIMKIQQWANSYPGNGMITSLSAPVTYPVTRSYKAEDVSPSRKRRFRAFHNNRRLTAGRGFRWQLITVRSKKTGRIIGYKSIYHEN